MGRGAGRRVGRADRRGDVFVCRGERFIGRGVGRWMGRGGEGENLCVACAGEKSECPREETRCLLSLRGSVEGLPRETENL